MVIQATTELMRGRPSAERSVLHCLDPEETAEALPYEALIPAMARAAQEVRNGRMAAPERVVVPIGQVGALLCMPAVAEDLGMCKLITVHPGNPRQGLKTIQGEVVVFEATTGRRLLLLDGPTLTARRTAAVTLLGIRTLCARAPRSALLIGAGEQAVAHAEALADTVGVTRFCVAAPTRGRAEHLAERLAATRPWLEITTAEASRLPAVELEAADVIIALTTSTRPVIPPLVKDTTLVVGVGAYRPDMAEIPPELIRRRRVVVDHLAGAKAEAGDLIQAGIAWDEVLELGEFFQDGAGPSPGAPMVLKTVGHSSWDLAAARVAVTRIAPAATGI